MFGQDDRLSVSRPVQARRLLLSQQKRGAMSGSHSGSSQGSLPVDVLVVDDDSAVRTSFATILRDAGFEVGEAENGAVALAILSFTKIGAVVLDVRMPELDGLGLLDALSEPPPVILMSSEVGKADIMARSSKIFAYASKPIPPQALLDLVARALGEGRRDDITEYQITCVGRSLVPGGHTHITQVGTDFGRRGWEINQLVQRLAAGDTFYVEAPGKGRSLAFFDKCACTFESIRTIEGAYQSVDHLDAVPLCT